MTSTETSPPNVTLQYRKFLAIVPSRSRSLVQFGRTILKLQGKSYVHTNVGRVALIF